jgi:hypothetical protein
VTTAVARRTPNRLTHSLATLAGTPDDSSGITGQLDAIAQLAAVWSGRPGP